MKERLTQQSSSRGFSVLGTASILCKVLALIYLPIQTAIVGYSGNGVINNGFKIYMFMYSLANVGLPIAISKFVSELETRGDYRGTRRVMKCAFTILLSLGVISTIVLFLGAGWFARVYCKQPSSELMIKTIAPAFLLTAVSCALRGYFQGRQNMIPTALSQIIEQVLNTLFTVVFVYLMFNIGTAKHADAYAFAAAGSSIGTVIGAIGAAAFLSYLFFYVFKEKRHKEYQNQTYQGLELTTKYIYLEMLKYAVPAIISAIATSAIDLIDTSTITRMLERGGYTSIQSNDLWGIYSTNYQRLFTLAIAFTTPLVTAMIPSISSAFSVNNQKLFKQRIHESYKLIYLIMLPCIAGLTFLAKPMITFIFINKNAGEGLVILGTWTAIFMAISYIQSGILISIGRPLISPINIIIGMLVKLLCNFVLIPLHSVNIYGAVIGNAVAWIIAIILNQYFINRSINGTLHSARLLIVPSSMSMIMGICCLLVYKLFYLLLGLILHGVLANDIALLISVAVGIVIYFTLMIKLGGTKAEDISRLPMGSRILRLLRKLPFLQKDLQKKFA